MKIVFLDVDGVLNHERYYKERSLGMNDGWKRKHPLTEIDKVAVSYLNIICEENDAKVVISSTWRLGKPMEYVANILKKTGFTGEVIGVTPCIDLHHKAIVRGNEIYQWIQDNEEITGKPYFEYDDYVIIDDDCDMLYYQRNNFIHIDGHVGITPRDIARAGRIFRNPKYKIYE